MSTCVISVVILLISSLIGLRMMHDGITIAVYAVKFRGCQILFNKIDYSYSTHT